MHTSPTHHRFIRQLVDAAVEGPLLNALVALKRARVEQDALFAAAREGSVTLRIAAPEPATQSVAA
ncbi:MAG: hypothetical protein IPK80_08740 [Nannocystis sp.]|nr:hypothetical protein [Nannocystis sp.]